MDHVKVIVFDANETLLDLSALDPLFARAFGDPGTRALWFTQLLQLFLTATVIDAYQPFDVLGDAALDVVATQRGRALAAHDRAAIREALLALPPHPDVRPAPRPAPGREAAAGGAHQLHREVREGPDAARRSHGLLRRHPVGGRGQWCGFRRKAITRFAPSRSPVSPEADHRFRSKAITRFAEGDQDVGG